MQCCIVPQFLKRRKKKVILAVYTVTLIANDLKAFFVLFFDLPHVTNCILNSKVTFITEQNKLYWLVV